MREESEKRLSAETEETDAEYAKLKETIEKLLDKWAEEAKESKDERKQ